MFITLLKYQLRMGINTLLRSPRLHQLGWIIAAWCVCFYYYFLTMSLVQIYRTFETENLTGFVKMNFGMVFLLATLNVASATFYKLYRRADLPILISLPIKKSAMFKLKLFEAFKDSAKSLAFPMPLYISYMMILNSTVWEWVIFIIGWLLITLIISGFGVIASVVLSSYFSESGARLIARIIALVVAIAFVIIFIGYGRIAESGNISTLKSLSSYASNRVLGIFPTSWLVEGIIFWRSQNIASFAISWLKISVFFSIALLFSVRIYVLRFDKSWALMSEQGPKKRSKIANFSTLKLGVFGSMLLKELKVLWRESYIWLNLIAPLTMVGFMIILGDQFPGSSRSKYLIQASIVSISVSITHSLSSIGREGRTFYLIRTLPINAEVLLWAKALAGSIPNLAFTEIYLIASFFIKPIMGIWESLFFGVFISLYFSLIGVSSGALFPKFYYSNPARAGALSGSVFMYFLSSVFIGSLVALEADGLGALPLTICLGIWMAFAMIISMLAAKSLQRRDVSS